MEATLKTEQEVRTLLASVQARLRADAYASAAGRMEDLLRESMLLWFLGKKA